jgi:nicotinate-nucleotide--dimethylbenzimidazole phosphoribosyltransferase
MDMDDAPVRSLDEVRSLLSTLPAADAAAAAAVTARENNLLKPPGALGRLEDLTAWLAAWQGRSPPRLDDVRAVVFAGNHGVAARGVSAYPASVTEAMVAAFERRQAAINQICLQVDVALTVDPLALDTPTADFTEAPALSDDAFVEAINRGLAAAAAGGDLLCLGEMGIANTTAAAALVHALYGGAPAAWTGPGTGVDTATYRRKVDAVAAGVRRHRAEARDPLDLLRRIGGREMAAIVGAVLGARLRRMPVILDGFTATAAAAVLTRLRPDALDHCQVGHVSAEPGHRLLLSRLGRRPLFDLSMRLGEASGAVLAVALVRAAVACHTGMATFAEAGVSGADT